MIIEQIEVTFMAVFCYLIGDQEGGRAVLIDPAGDYDAIRQRIEAHNLTVDWIINTHGHWDHTSGNDLVAKETGAKLLIHQADAPLLKSLTSKVLSRFLGGKGSPDPVQLLEDGDVVEVGSLKLKVIHTPGHSRGSICLYHPGHIFTGDTLFTEGYGRTDLPGGSEQQLFHSIRQRILTLADNTIIWPGHNYGADPSITVGEQKRFYGTG